MGQREGPSLALMQCTRLVEQPYKIPVYATLIAYLQTEFTREPDAVPDELHPVVRALLDDIVKGFQTYLDALKWLPLKLCVRS